MTCAYQIAFFSEKLPQPLFAVVRYTCYGEDGKAISVDTIEYEDTKEGKNCLQGQVMSSLECDIDVTIMSSKGIKDFPYLQKMLNLYYISVVAHK